MNIWYALLIGLTAGAHASTWGMYKDAPHEGFTWPKYSRSIIIAGLFGILIQQITGIDPSRAAGIVVLWGLVYASERLLLELWKGYIREEDQSKYFIPMQFGVMGKPVKDRRIRWSVLAGILVVLVLVGLGTRALQRSHLDLPPWLVLFTIGSLGGWLTAFGGAWKDAPVEGFETFKFFRSPGISLFWAVVVSFFTRDWILISIAGAGYSVATIETYKTFFFPSKPRGKFAGKPITDPHILTWRYRFLPIYVAIWIGVLVSFAVAFSEPHQGLM